MALFQMSLGSEVTDKVLTKLLDMFSYQEKYPAIDTAVICQKRKKPSQVGSDRLLAVQPGTRAQFILVCLFVFI